jgi:hypothetical protein
VPFGSASEVRPLQRREFAADVPFVDRRVIWIFVGVGMTVGGLLPEAWGGSALGLASLALASLGGVAGLWLAAKLTG